MTLANLNINETKHIKRLLGDNPIKPRLLSLGFHTGNSVTILQKSFGNVVIAVGDTRFGIALNLLKIIEIEDE